MNQGYTSEEIYEDLLAKASTKQGKKVKEIEEQQKLYEKGYKDGVEFCKTIMLEKFALAGYKFDKNK